jgi:hypothetical protein
LFPRRRRRIQQICEKSTVTATHDSDTLRWRRWKREEVVEEEEAEEFQYNGLLTRRSRALYNIVRVKD